MTDLLNIRDKIEEKKQKEKKAQPQDQKPAQEKVDLEQVDKIVERMKKKYQKEGVDFQKAEGSLEGIRGMVVESGQDDISLQRIEDLQDFQNPTVKNLGKFYLTFRKLLEPVSNMIYNMPVANDVRFYLYSANMKLSLVQWLALSVSAAVIVSVIAFFFTTTVVVIAKQSLVIPIILTICAVFSSLLVMLLIPRSLAQRRGIEVSRELPFALRHMATELKAGIGLYKALQTIASSNYGVLSEEFARTIAEIEEGTDTKDALRHFALRTQSKALKNSLFHIIRAMKTGGSLSEIMNVIAEDVSFDIRVRIKEFAEKLNFFGVIYIFAAIVIPVFIAVIGSVTNAPVSLGGIAIPPIAIALILLVVMPAVLGFLAIFLKMTQPQV